MKKILFSLALIVSAMLFSGCTLTKHLTYFQNIDSVNLAQAAAPFNFNASSSSMGSGSSNITTYIVDKDGMINFPVLGKIKVQGKTRPEVEDYITELVQPYFSAKEQPVVKVRISNFKVTVIGAIGTNVLTVQNERMSIIEAIARSGDLNIYGKRPNILLIREDAKGEKTTARFNINDANILNSPYYFLEQNDIIYVEPHKMQARSADVNSYTFWAPLTSMVFSLATMVIAITKW